MIMNLDLRPTVTQDTTISMQSVQKQMSDKMVSINLQQHCQIDSNFGIF